MIKNNAIYTGNNAPLLVDKNKKSECEVSGTHTGSEVVRYVDGVVVSRCDTCDARLELRDVSGGVESQIVYDIAMSILGGELPLDDRFSKMVAELQENYEEMGRVLKTARWVQQERS